MLKVLKLLGFEECMLEETLANLSFSIKNLQDEFKILIITRGIIDKFISKPSRKSYPRLKDFKQKNTAISKIREITNLPLSGSFETEQFFQGNHFLLQLYKVSQLEKIFINIPDCILLGAGLLSPVRLWTNSLGIVRAREFSIAYLTSEIQGFKINDSFENANFILKFEYKTPNKVVYHAYCYKITEIEEMVSKVNEAHYFKSLVVICQHIKGKGNLSCKTRAYFSKNISKLYLASTEKQNNKTKNLKLNLTSIISSSLLDSLNLSTEELKTFEDSFKCKLLFPVKINPNLFINEIYENEFFGFAKKVLEMLQTIINSTIEMENYSSFKPRLKLFNQYLSCKIKKIDRFLIDRQSVKSGHELLIDERKIWEKQQMVHIEDKDIKVYEILNQQKVKDFEKINREIIRFLKNCIPQNKNVSEIVADFIETNQGIYLIKLLHIRFESRKLVSLPSISNTKHISLYSATEGSGFIKGKINRQLLCCGDYCSLLKRNDFETRERIEFLMKHHLEFAGTLFELMKLQDILNIDTVHHLLDRAKRPVTPITTQTQYKVLRKIIIEDRLDKYSLRSLILHLPHDVIRELNIILQETSTISELSISFNGGASKSVSINKKLHWEFELVPVCDICYKIYSKRIKGNKETQSKSSTHLRNTKASKKSTEVALPRSIKDLENFM